MPPKTRNAANSAGPIVVLLLNYASCRKDEKHPPGIFRSGINSVENTGASTRLQLPD
jgi:hypothetical protein